MATPKTSRGRNKRTRSISLREILRKSDAELLELPISSLHLPITPNSYVHNLILKVGKELRAQGLNFFPQVWYSDEWFCPDGVYGLAIPFYLAHPRLTELHKKMRAETEGATPDEACKILRHEVGHAVDNGYRLRRNRNRQKIFGKVSQTYPRRYIYQPYSRQFVRHLRQGYAQSHPAEDFAETFAVWLNPNSNWREQYAGWGAYRKLEFMNELMQSIRGTPPDTWGKPAYTLPQMTKTLGQHYQQLQRRNELVRSQALLVNLDRMLVLPTEPSRSISLTSLRNNSSVMDYLVQQTGAPRYRLQVFLKQLCRERPQQQPMLYRERLCLPIRALPTLAKAAQLFLAREQDAISL